MYIYEYKKIGRVAVYTYIIYSLNYNTVFFFIFSKLAYLICAVG